MNTYRPENGGIFLEFLIFTFILALFTAGAAKVHNSFHKRFEAVLVDRNSGIAQIREQKKTPKYLSNSVQPSNHDFGHLEPQRNRK
jgi:hypothetical protein